MAKRLVNTKKTTRSRTTAAVKKSVGSKKTLPQRPLAGRKKIIKKMASRKIVSKKPARSAKRLSWLDEQAQTPVIDRYARQLGSFLDALADGKVDESEIKGQEARLVKLMKEIEPQLDTTLHTQVTRLLCELTAYDIMQMMHALQHARSQTSFHG